MKNIRNILAVILFLVIAKVGVAQQEPMFNLYHQNLFLLNPANTGDQDFMQVFFDTRKQWSGIEGAPSTSAFGIHDSFNDKVGLGMLITSDKAGMIERLSGSLNYSYKLRISDTKRHFITFGLGLGFLENKIDFTDVIATDYSDPVFALGNYDGFAFDARFGFKYDYKDFELAASIPQILDNDLNYNRNGYEEYDFALKRHYVFFTSYNFRFFEKEVDENMQKVKTDNERFYIKPSLLYKMLPGAPSQFDINLVVGNSNDQWAGVTYRPTNNSFVIAAGINVYNLNIAYAYQIANTPLTMYSNGTHEIMVAYKFRKAKEEEDNLNKDLMNLMENQKNMKGQLDNLNKSVNELKENSKEKPGGALEMLEQELKSEIDSLRNQINGKKTTNADGSVIFESDNDQINRLQKELDELKKYVLQITGEDVVELKSDGNNNLVETPLENGNYVIIYSFRKLDYAKRAVKMTAEKGIKSSILYNKDRKWYYIYTYKYDDLQPALEKMRETRKGEYSDSWVHIYKR